MAVMTRRTRVALVAVAGLAVAGAAAAVVFGGPASHSTTAGAQTSAPSSSPAGSAIPTPPPVDASAIAALPEARYSAVIGGLVGFDRTVGADVTPSVFHI